MLFAIWYNLYNLKNVKNTHGEVLPLVQLATLLKVTILHGCFLRFLICTNSTKSRKASRIKSIPVFANDNFLSRLIHFHGRNSRNKQGFTLNVARILQEKDIPIKMINHKRQ